MRFHESNATFKYNWEQVVKAFWCRYPNPYSAHVLTEDVVQRSVDNNGNLFTKRLISKTNRCPKWMERFLSNKLVYIIEESVLDPNNKILTTYTRNIGLQHLMTIEEKVVYRPNGDHNHWTIAERQAWINSSVFGVSRAVQAFGIERFKKNVNKACKGFQFVLESLYSNPSVDTFSNPSHNPLLHQRLKEKAVKASEFAAKAKSKAVPIVIAKIDD